jgi:hypothetical protein
MPSTLAYDRSDEPKSGATPASADVPELAAVDRLLANLHDDNDPFELPHRDATASSAASPALLTWSLQPLPALPTESPHEGALAWLFLTAGLIALACGGTMLVWSVPMGREDLWSLGLPLALGGQGAIIFGLIGLLEVASGRQKSLKTALDEHRQRLERLQNLGEAAQASHGIRRAA